MTLDEMYQECASYIDETLEKYNGEYTGDSIEITNKLRSAINYAYKKICREKYSLEFKEIVASGSPLTKELVRVKYVKVNGDKIPYTVEVGLIVFDFDDQAEILYNYIPEDLVNLTDTPELPEGKIDHKILCYYAAFQYFNIEDDSRAQNWLSMWEDAFNTINRSYTHQTSVNATY